MMGKDTKVPVADNVRDNFYGPFIPNNLLRERYMDVALRTHDLKVRLRDHLKTHEDTWVNNEKLKLHRDFNRKGLAQATTDNIHSASIETGVSSGTRMRVRARSVSRLSKLKQTETRTLQEITWQLENNPVDEDQHQFDFSLKHENLRMKP